MRTFQKLLRNFGQNINNLTNIVLWEHFDQKTITGNPYCLLRKFWVKDKKKTKKTQTILPFKKLSSIDVNNLTHTAFAENFDQKTKRFSPISSLKKILNLTAQFKSTDVVFSEKFDQKTKQFIPHCLSGKFWPKTIQFNPYCLSREI